MQGAVIPHQCDQNDQRELELLGYYCKCSNERQSYLSLYLERTATKFTYCQKDILAHD